MQTLNKLHPFLVRVGRADQLVDLFSRSLGNVHQDVQSLGRSGWDGLEGKISNELINSKPSHGEQPWHAPFAQLVEFQLKTVKAVTEKQLKVIDNGSDKFQDWGCAVLRESIPW